MNPVPQAPVPGNSYPDVTTFGDVLTSICYARARDAGWWIDPQTGGDVRSWAKKHFDLWVASKLMLAVTELAEAMEGHRKNLHDGHLPQYPMLAVELADCVIRCCDLAGGLGISLGEVIQAKLEYNAQRADHKLEARTGIGGKTI